MVRWCSCVSVLIRLRRIHEITTVTKKHVVATRILLKTPSLPCLVKTTRLSSSQTIYYSFQHRSQKTPFKKLKSRVSSHCRILFSYSNNTTGYFKKDVSFASALIFFLFLNWVSEYSHFRPSLSLALSLCQILSVYCHTHLCQEPISIPFPTGRKEKKIIWNNLLRKYSGKWS
jgi:hypothetical protein